MWPPQMWFSLMCHPTNVALTDMASTDMAVQMWSPHRCGLHRCGSHKCAPLTDGAFTNVSPPIYVTPTDLALTDAVPRIDVAPHRCGFHKPSLPLPHPTNVALTNVALGPVLKSTGRISSLYVLCILITCFIFLSKMEIVKAV